MDESDMNEREMKKKTPEICCDTITNNNNNNSKSLDHQLIFPN